MTGRATTTPQIKNLIVRVSENRRAARAARTYEQVRAILCKTTTWNYLIYSFDDNLFNFVFLCPKCLLQFNSRTVRTRFLSIMTLNNWKMITETRSYIFRWRSRLRWCRVCLSSLIRKFKIYDATVAKKSLKIASSSFSIYSVFMSVCLTFES